MVKSLTNNGKNLLKAGRNVGWAAETGVGAYSNELLADKEVLTLDKPTKSELMLLAIDLENNDKLRKLTISDGSLLGDPSAEGLASMLANNNKLSQVRIRCAVFNDQAAMRFISALKKNWALVILEISGIDNQIVIVINSQLQKNKDMAKSMREDSE